VGLSDWIQLGTGIVLFLTLLAILWYAYETRVMRKQIDRDRLFAVEPTITIEPRGSSTNSVTVKLVNVGRGPAFNIQCAVKHPAFDMLGKFIQLHHLPVGVSHEQTIHAD